jgi:hypothetical protein
VNSSLIVHEICLIEIIVWTMEVVLSNQGLHPKVRPLDGDYYIG